MIPSNAKEAASEGWICVGVVDSSNREAVNLITSVVATETLHLTFNQKDRFTPGRPVLWVKNLQDTQEARQALSRCTKVPSLKSFVREAELQLSQTPRKRKDKR